METFDFTQPAELFATMGHRSKRAPVTYRRFPSGAEAVKFAIEGLTQNQLFGTVMEVSEERFDAAAIRELYDSPGYPLARGPSRDA